MVFDKRLAVGWGIHVFILFLLYTLRLDYLLIYLIFNAVIGKLLGDEELTIGKRFINAVIIGPICMIMSAEDKDA